MNNYKVTLVVIQVSEDHSDSSDVKKLKSRMKLLIDRVDLLEERINKLDDHSLKSRIDIKTFNSN